MTTTPLVVAHRGASLHSAEHSKAAYRLALAHGADAVECDVRLTRDGHLVCVHDRTINRTSTGTGTVSAMTLDQLRRFDFESWHERYEPTGEAPGVLAFEDLLGLVRDSGSKVKLFVETKHPVRYAGRVEAELARVLDRHGFTRPRSHNESQVFVMSFSGAALKRMRVHTPLLPTVFLFETFVPPLRRGWLPRCADIAGPDVNLLHLDPDYVRRCTDRGTDVYCWTVNALSDVRLCQQLGVRYLATDSPRETKKALTGQLTPNRDNG